jgi:hypothetical protein
MDHRRWQGLCVAVLVALLIGLVSASASAAAESSDGSGWTPQGEAAAPESDGGPVQQGSSLGSGAGAAPTEPATEAPATGGGSTGYVEPSTPEYSEGGSSEYSEPSSSAPAEVESAPAVTTPAPAEKPAATKLAGGTAEVDAGTPTVPAAAPPAAAAAATPAAETAPVVSAPADDAAGSSGVPTWLLALGAVLILLWVGRALVLAFRRRRSARPTPDPDWRPEAGEWEAVLEQIQRERSVGGKVRPLREVGAEPDFGVAVADEDGRVAG